MKVYAYDCRDTVPKENPEKFGHCQNTDELPYITLIKPPNNRININSLDIEPNTVVPYSDNELTANSFYKFIVENMPDYLINIGNNLQLEQLRDGVPIRDINKVVILGNKEKPLPEFLALAAEFRDRLMIGYVPKSSEEVYEEFSSVK